MKFTTAERQLPEIAMYFVVPAPGHYGDKTTVISSHKSASAAKRAATKGYVARIGSKKKGDEFTRAAESIYPVAK